MRLFNFDSPLMQSLNKIADLMWLNILTLICCIPVITVGPALTALHYTALKIVRDEECYIMKDFWKSFKLNLRQGIAIWLIELVIIALLVGDFLILQNVEVAFGEPMRVALMVVAILILFIFTFAYPVLAKFENTVMRTLKNALFIGILQFPKAILMMIVSVIPALLFVMAPQVLPIVLLFCFSAPAWVSAKLYNKFFKKLENEMKGEDDSGQEEAGTAGEDERIFKDELDESLQEAPSRIEQS